MIQGCVVLLKQFFYFTKTNNRIMGKKIKFQRNHGKAFAIFLGKKVELWCSAWSHIKELKVKSVQAVLLPTIRMEYTPSSINFDEYWSLSVMFGFLFWYAKLDIIFWI